MSNDVSNAGFHFVFPFQGNGGDGVTASVGALATPSNFSKCALALNTNIRELQSVLGFFNYNSKFIPRYAARAHPLYQLLRKETRFIWTEECEESFQDLREAVTTSPTLCLPDIEDPHQSYQVQLDASKHGFGATLTQLQDEERRTIAYFSRASS